MKAENDYTGVSWDRINRSWKVVFSHKGIRYLNTNVFSAKDGAKMRDMIIIKNNLDVPLQVFRKKIN